MTQGRGASASDYAAPLFLAWQVTNRCGSRCLPCCEESGPDKNWPGELSRREALGLARRIAVSGIPYVAFGGGEPLLVPHFFEIVEILSSAGIGVKIETDGTLIDDALADHLSSLKVRCVQVSLDGATPETHERLRPGGSFEKAAAALRRLAERGLDPDAVFVPTALNIKEAPAVFDMAAGLGARAFVTGPLMRLGRAAADWDRLSPSKSDWNQCLKRLKEREKHHKGKVALSVYPWDILEEIRVRAKYPQAMILVVPDGKVKLLNALPFAPADLKVHSIEEAWKLCRAAWDHSNVQDFCRKVLRDLSLLKHANETWPVPS